MLSAYIFRPTVTLLIHHTAYTFSPLMYSSLYSPIDKYIFPFSAASTTSNWALYSIEPFFFQEKKKKKSIRFSSISCRMTKKIPMDYSGVSSMHRGYIFHISFDGLEKNHIKSSSLYSYMLIIFTVDPIGRPLRPGAYKRNEIWIHMRLASYWSPRWVGSFHPTAAI